MPSLMRSSRARPSSVIAVEAARAFGGMLPLPDDEPALLQPPQQRIDRVRIHRQQAGAERLDPRHQAGAVVGPVRQQMKDQDREDRLGLDRAPEDLFGRAGRLVTHIR